jgi:hypothetical protein
LGASGGYVNGIWIEVTVCVPGSTTQCQSIPNVLVDTGSVGLRLLSSALTVSLPGVTASNGNALQECVQYADFSYTWGPVAAASIGMTGTSETAAQVPGQAANSGVPIQIIAASPVAPVPSSCLSAPSIAGMTVDANTLESLGSNGILGIGTFPQDCGAACAEVPEPQYYVCPNGSCTEAVAPLAHQLWNPVAAFSSSDTNGVLLTLPSLAAGGAPLAEGTLVFGIGTQSNNAIGSAQVYEVDEYGNFPKVVYGSMTYTSPNNGSFIDSGSTNIFFSDAGSLASTGIVECGGELAGYYCPSAVVPFSVTAFGANNVQGVVQFNISNASALLNTGNAVFNDLGGDSGTGPSTDYLDLGLPFFFGRTVYVGIAGSSATYPNGYWAFESGAAGVGGVSAAAAAAAARPDVR